MCDGCLCVVDVVGVVIVFGQFVFELVDQFVYWFVSDFFEVVGVVDCFFLVVFGLVDVDQVFECLWGVLVDLG